MSKEVTENSRNSGPTWLLAATPWMPCLMLLAMMGYIFFTMNPARVDLETELPVALKILQGCFSFALFLSILSPFAWLLLVCSKRFRGSVKEHAVQIFVWVAGAGVVNFSPVWDPTGNAGRIFYW